MNFSEVSTYVSRVPNFGLFLVFLFLGFGFTMQYTNAQEASLVWTPQQRVPGYLNRTQQPILIADPMGVVHAFAYQQVGDPDERREVAVIYSTWSYENGWTLPTDIILSPIKQQARVMDVYLDPQGLFHLIFFGGDDLEANLYYSQAHISQAYSAQSWMAPVLIGQRALTPSMAKLTGDGRGNLLALYSGNLDGPGIFKVSSTDGGDTWASPEPFFLTYGRDLRPFGLNMSWGNSEIIHVVWQVVNERGHNIAGYYSQINMQSGHWNRPIELADPIGVERGMGLAEPSVIEYSGEIFVMYNNGIPPTGVPPGLWFRQSSDGGLTWSTAIRPFPQHVGRNGAGSFVVDSSGQLHVLFGQRVPQGTGITDIHGMWHSTWQGSFWSEPEAVISAPLAPGFDPGNNYAVVSRGNVLLVVWRTDPGNERPGVWYSYTTLNSPELPPVALPTHSADHALEQSTFDQASTLDSSPVQAVDNGSDGLVEPSWAGTNATTDMTAAGPVQAGGIAVIILLVFTLLIHYLWGRGSYL
jgi:hypothetical protein